MGKRNSITRNIFHLFYSTALTSGLNAGALILLAYYLQSHHYGIFSVVMAFAMIMAYFTDAGLSDIVLREGSKKGVNISVLMSSYVKMRAVLLLLTLAAGFLLIEWHYSHNQEIIQTGYFLILPMVTGVAMQSISGAYFQLMEKMQYDGLVRITSAVGLIASITTGMLLSLHPFAVCFLYGFSYFLAGILGIYLVTKNIRFDFKSRFHRGLFDNLGSFTLGGLLFIILPHLGPLILEKTVSLAEIGFFAVAYRIPQALQQIPFVVAGAYYPVLFRHFNSNQLSRHLELNITQVKIMALIGMGLTIPFFYLSEFFITLLFGEQWLTAAFPLKILSLMLTFQAINIALADGLTTRGLQNYRTFIQIIAIISGVFLYFFLSNSYGIMGAAFAGLTIEIITLAGFWMLTPGRWQVCRKAILPYLLFFLSVLWTFDFIFQAVPFAGASLHLLLLATLLYFDKELNLKLKRLIAESPLAAKWKLKKTQGVENG
ncbi:oligosaccharide flippase family protein [Alteribacillus sp. HJP-4]|uniref:oligosaccharide flippase family protein n=1 Tax=Alteribacillus sp. HJP-4 TaxID=2775394 RepID=UPI0035CCFD55